MLYQVLRSDTDIDRHCIMLTPSVREAFACICGLRHPELSAYEHCNFQ